MGDLDHPVFYLCVYPKGDRSRITVVCAQDFDVPDYDLASHKHFNTPLEGCQYAKKLAWDNAKMYVPYDFEPGEEGYHRDGILDNDE